ncbi:MAG: Type 1 glutamine amidotransferase-like domain-containing protein [Candidatus Elarobacter sp.]
MANVPGARSRGTIVALGGGGFITSGAGSPLDRYVLAAARRPNPRVCFIPTASADPAAKVRHFYRAFRAVTCRPSHLDLFRQTVVDVDAYLREQDVIYVGGGNTRNLLLLWKAWRVDRALRAAHAGGAVLAGVSAGALCWFRDGITDSYPARLAPIRALGLIDRSFAPHYDSEEQRRPVFHGLIARGRLGSGYAAEDGVALRFERGVLREAVTEIAGKRAYRVARVAQGVREDALETRLLPP